MGRGRDKRRSRSQLRADIARLEYRLALKVLELERADEVIAEAWERERRAKAPAAVVITEHDTPTE